MTDRICREAIKRLNNEHIKKIGSYELLLISAQYNGLWLEHVYDSVMLAKMDTAYLPIAKNTIDVFCDNQRNGQYPFRVIDDGGVLRAEYSQIQECVSFITLGAEVADMLGDTAFARKVYESGTSWIEWLKKHRMTLGRGLIEMFVGYDTGHDNSPRLDGLLFKNNYVLPDGSIADADILPPGERTAPVITVDMNCNFYADLKALSYLAEKLGDLSTSKDLASEAECVKARLFDVCFDADDVFFYDVDRNGAKRKYLSSTIFHLFMERVLDPENDAELIEKLISMHIKNKNEFMTEYPFPSMAVSDPSCKQHTDFNCWGYYTQGLTVLRCTRWMDFYNMSRELDYICEKWVQAWTRCYDRFKLGQEIDPHTGEPTGSSEWYSSCMLMYLYAVKRLGHKDP